MVKKLVSDATAQRRILELIVLDYASRWAEEYGHMDLDGIDFELVRAVRDLENF